MSNLELRITPAYAGSSAKQAKAAGVVEDHPRIRGEQCLLMGNLRLTAGSPPHTRGAVGPNDYVDTEERITPAYAGSRVRRTCWSWMSEDHPRIRGEQTPSCPVSTCHAGSPPHTRGAVALIISLVVTCRITPAYAGSSHSILRLQWYRPDHPRIRGEQFVQDDDVAIVSGSPPHTRGAV